MERDFLGTKCIRVMRALQTLWSFIRLRNYDHFVTRVSFGRLRNNEIDPFLFLLACRRLALWSRACGWYGQWFNRWLSDLGFGWRQRTLSVCFIDVLEVEYWSLLFLLRLHFFLFNDLKWVLLFAHPYRLIFYRAYNNPVIVLDHLLFLAWQFVSLNELVADLLVLLVTHPNLRTLV
jgi:hypothetical protein